MEISLISSSGTDSPASTMGCVVVPALRIEKNPYENIIAQATTAERNAAAEVRKGNARIVLSLTGGFFTVSLSFT